MKAGERHELELVTHRAELALEPGDRRCVKVLPPVEGRRAVVGEHLVGCDLVHCLRELPRLGQVGRRRLTPEQIGVRRVRYGAGNGAVELTSQTEESLWGAVADAKLAIPWIDVARE